MKKFMQKKLNQKGLTLVELLAVIVILGIIAAIAVPAIGNIITNSKVNALKADGQNILAAAQMYFTENGSKDGVDVTQKTLTDDGFLEDAGGFAGTEAVAATVNKTAKGNTITGTATNKGIKVAFNKAPASDINKVGTKNDSSVTTITITR